MSQDDTRPGGAMAPCATCGHARLYHAAGGRGGRRRGCHAQSCSCPGFAPVPSAATLRNRRRKAEREAQGRLFDPGR